MNFNRIKKKKKQIKLFEVLVIEEETIKNARWTRREWFNSSKIGKTDWPQGAKW